MKSKINFKNSTIAILLTIIIINVTLGITSSQMLQSLKNEVQVLQGNTLRIMFAASQMKLATVQVQQFLTDISATRASNGLDDGFKKAEEWAKKFRDGSDIIKENSTDPGILNFQKEIDEAFEDFYLMGQKMAHEYIKGGPEKGNIFMEKFDPFAEKITQLLEKLNLEVNKPIQIKFVQINNLTDQTYHITNLISIISILISILGTTIIVVYLKKIKESLTITATSMLEKASQFSSESNNLAQRTQVQSVALEETSATTEEITSMIRQTADLSSKASVNSKVALQASADGLSSAQEAQTAMKEITGSSLKISKIISLVEEIAFQTNILAVNAAIEAAKAGENGKGFSVVAIEVRDLAQRASELTKEIKNLIDSSHLLIKDGEKLTTINEQKLIDISQRVELIAKNINEISEETKNQHQSIEQINKTILDLDNSTQENANLVTELFNLSDSLSQESQKMKQVIQNSIG